MKMVSLLDPKEEAREKRTRMLWLIMLSAAAAALVFVVFFRSNRPATFAEAPHYYTEHGPFINEPISIEPGKFRSFKLDLNRPGTLQGTFILPDRKTNVGCYVLTEENFEKWKNGEQNFETLIFTGFVWAGKVDRKLLPGVYYFVLDNRVNPSTAVDVTVDIGLN